MVFKIKDWDETFENNKSRAIKCPRYVAWPVRRDSEAFVHLSRLPNFLEAFGLFGILVQLAARCETRGVLADDRGALTPERVARRYGLKVKAVTEAWDSLACEDVGWLVSDDARAPSAHVGADSAHAQARSAALSSSPSTPLHSSPSTPVDTSTPQGNPGAEEAPFDRFWKAWPNHKRKTDRKACLGYWTKSKLDAEGEAIVRSLTRWKRSEAWTDEGGAYIPLPLTWLRGERWKEKPKYAEAFAPPSAEALAFAQELIDQKAIAEGMVDPRKEKANEAK